MHRSLLILLSIMLFTGIQGCISADPKSPVYERTRLAFDPGLRTVQRPSGSLFNGGQAANSGTSGASRSASGWWQGGSGRSSATLARFFPGRDPNILGAPNQAPASASPSREQIASNKTSRRRAPFDAPGSREAQLASASLPPAVPPAPFLPVAFTVPGPPSTPSPRSGRTIQVAAASVSVPEPRIERTEFLEEPAIRPNSELAQKDPQRSHQPRAVKTEEVQDQNVDPSTRLVKAEPDSIPNDKPRSESFEPDLAKAESDLQANEPEAVKHDARPTEPLDSLEEQAGLFAQRHERAVESRHENASSTPVVNETNGQAEGPQSVAQVHLPPRSWP